MPTLHDALAAALPPYREKIKSIVHEHGEKIVSEVSVRQVFGGMRGVISLHCDTSLVTADKGLHIRGKHILELADLLPEEIFYMLLTGERPDAEGLKLLQQDLAGRMAVPDYVWNVLRAMPAESHPMAMFNTAILVMQAESVFARRYDEGAPKLDWWKYVLEDSLNIIAKLPVIGAGIYRLRYGKGEPIPPKEDLDWGANFAHMLGVSDDPNFARLMQLYLTLHCDHEGGNVSAFSSQVVGSALADPYYSLSAGLNGLAGPLHGLANQNCLRFVLGIRDKFNGVPDDDQLTKFVWETLNSGKVIPGYGHAVLRSTDPRFTAFNDFGKEHLGDDPVFNIVNKMFERVPGILKEHGKASSPWPNVDAGSGALLHYYGLKEFSYYTVLFSISRALGILAQTILNRGVGAPIIRPKSLGTDRIVERVQGS